MANRCDARMLTDSRHPSLLCFLNLAAQRNTVRAFSGPPFPAASGMQSYKNFCDFVGRRPFAVASDTVLLRVGLFRPWVTFGIYLSHLMKASILLRQPTDWLTAEVRSVSSGLRNAHVVSFRFPNFMFPPDLLRLVRTVKLSSDFGQSAFLSFLLLLRVPSETLQLRKADNSDLITEFPLTPLRFWLAPGALQARTC